MKIGKTCLISIAFGIAILGSSSQIAAFSALVEQEKDDEASLPARLRHSVEMELPLNISMPDSMRPLLCKMLKRSPTFRSQCYQISQSRRLRIAMKLVAEIPWTRCQALSRVKKYLDGQLEITMLIIAAKNNYVEMIGHEFEHALEQIEGLDLRILASAQRDLVYQNEDGIFETKRAIEAGLIVANEFNSFREQKNCDECQGQN